MKSTPCRACRGQLSVCSRLTKRSFGVTYSPEIRLRAAEDHDTTLAALRRDLRVRIGAGSFAPGSHPGQIRRALGKATYDSSPLMKQDTLRSETQPIGLALRQRPRHATELLDSMRRDYAVPRRRRIQERK